jgi:hypothetical protein
MKKLIGHILVAIWIFGSTSLIILNHKLNLNIPPRQLLFPIWFPIVSFIYADLTVDYVIPFIKNLFKK